MDTLYLFEFGAVFNPEVCELRGCVDGQKSDLSVQSQHSLIFIFIFKLSRDSHVPRMLSITNQP